MIIDRNRLTIWRDDMADHLQNELLPFWLERCIDRRHGGYLTHFDAAGEDTGVDEKSLIAQTRTLFTMASAHRAGYGEGACLAAARHGLDFLLERFADADHGGFHWLTDRAGRPLDRRKIVYGHSFAIYALAETALAVGDPRARAAAETTFALVQDKCLDSSRGGYFEMFADDWTLAGPGAGGGDRKTFDAHLHLMEAFTTLLELTGRAEVRTALAAVIRLLTGPLMHPEHGTGLAQCFPDWKLAPQIKFDVVWGHDRFADGDAKPHATDTTSFGHNVEFAWLLAHAFDVAGRPFDDIAPGYRRLLDHAVAHGLDREHGGLFVEGPHAGGVHDTDKEFWQQAEALVAFADAAGRFSDDRYLEPYGAVHRFVFDKVIHREVGEWWPLLTREGTPIWTHLGDNWKVNYHTVRSMIQTIRRLDALLEVA
jgi:mannose 2-epimerase